MMQSAPAILLRSATLRTSTPSARNTAPPQASTVTTTPPTAQRGRISCPVLALWSASGPLSTWYDDDGGPLALWSKLAPNVIGEPVDGGHFFPEERPSAIADALSGFFTR